MQPTLVILAAGMASRYADPVQADVLGITERAIGEERWGALSRGHAKALTQGNQHQLTG